MTTYILKKYTLYFLFMLSALSTITVAKIQPIDNWHADHKLKVMFLPTTELPMVDFRLLIKAGSSMDGSHNGLAYLTGSLLNQGTNKHDVNAISENFTHLGAIFSTATTKDFTSISLRTLTKTNILDAVLAQWLEIISSPSFPEPLIKLKKEQQLTNIKFTQQKPGTVASREFYKLLYNAKVPYANPGIGFTDTVSALTRAQIINFYKQYYSTHGAVLAIVGNITKQQAQKIANQISHALPNKKSMPIPQWPSINIKAHTKHINFPSTQTHIMLGTLGIKRGAKNTFPLYVGNRILGGGWPSQLFQNIRVKQGLAYSVHSYFLPLEHKGPFLITLQTSNKTAKHALSATKDLLKNFTSDGPTIADINKAKRYITGNFPLRINSNSKKISYIAMIGFYNLPLNYLDTFVDNINAVTKKDIRTAFRKIIDVNKMTLITVGEDKQ